MTLHISYSVCPIILRFDKTVLAIGTGFLYRRKDHHYLVTAWHNLSGRHSETLKMLDDKTAGLPNDMIVDMPQIIDSPEHGRTFTRMPIRFDFDDGVQPPYRVHAQRWPRVDVTVTPFDPEGDLHNEIYLSDGTTQEYLQPLVFQQADGLRSDIVTLTDDEVSVPLPANLLTPNDIVHTVGDSLFLLGFPAGVMDQSLTPIWKRASIATEPSIGWQGQKQFLVDSASRKGMSGGPTLYYSKNGQIPVHPGSQMSIRQPLHILHGIYVGRIGDSEFEAQVGVVWRKEIIDEIIDTGRPAISTHNIKYADSVVDQKIREVWPSGGGQIRTRIWTRNQACITSRVTSWNNSMVAVIRTWSATS